MPYIKQEDRPQFEDRIVPLFMHTPGELNYVLTLVIREYLENRKLSYQTINDIVGALEGAKLEFYRRVAVPYENQKIHENGDVYGTDPE